MHKKQNKRAVRRWMNPHMARYTREGFALGLTIAEWEAREGLPLFSVWPEAEHAREVTDPGRFLYCTATPAERLEMKVGHLRQRGCIDCGKLLGIGTRGECCVSCSRDRVAA